MKVGNAHFYCKFNFHSAFCENLLIYILLNDVFVDFLSQVSTLFEITWKGISNIYFLFKLGLWSKFVARWRMSRRITSIPHFLEVNIWWILAWQRGQHSIWLCQQSRKVANRNRQNVDFSLCQKIKPSQFSNCAYFKKKIVRRFSIRFPVRRWSLQRF